MKNWIEVKDYKVTSVQWKGENAGDAIEGVVEKFESILTRTGKANIVTLLNGDTKYSVFTNKVLQQKLEQANVAPGMEIKIEFLGKVQSKANPAWKYKNYKVYVASA